MSYRNTLLATAGISALAAGAVTASKYAELEEWGEAIAQLDRQALLNHQPMPVIDRPADPQHSGLKNSLWWKVALAILIIPTALFGIMCGVVIGASEGNVFQGIFGAGLFGAVALLATGPLALIAGFIIWSLKRNKITQAKIDYAIQEECVAIWNLREDARRQLAQGSKPVAYLEAIGIDPQSYQA